MSVEDAGWFGRSQENTPSLRARIAALEAEVARLREALSELVRLKDYKDKAGADASYYAQKIRAWDAARAALRKEETP